MKNFYYCQVEIASFVSSILFSALSFLIMTLNFKDYLTGKKNRLALSAALMSFTSGIFNTWFSYMIIAQEITNFASYSFYSSLLMFTFFFLFSITVDVPLAKRIKRQIFEIIFLCYIIFIIAYTAICYPSSFNNGDQILSFHTHKQYLNAIKFIFYNPHIENYKSIVIFRILFYLMSIIITFSFLSETLSIKEKLEAKICMSTIGGVIIFTSLVELFYNKIEFYKTANYIIYFSPLILKICMAILIIMLYKRNNKIQDIKTQIKYNTTSTLAILLCDYKESYNNRLKNVEIYLKEQGSTLNDLKIKPAELMRALPKHGINQETKKLLNKQLLQVLH